MIAFSQGLTAHSRIANSFLWMSKIKGLLEDNSLKYFFPWGYENYGHYLSRSSSWMHSNDAVILKFSEIFNRALSAESLSQVSSEISGLYYSENKIPYDYSNKIVFECMGGRVLFINGPVQFDSDELLNKMKYFELVICHEPFAYTYSNSDSLNADLINIMPNSDLFVKQLIFVNGLSNRKRNIGFHIRRGDYRNWQDGKYFYGDEFWLNKLYELRSDAVNIWIFTNEENVDFTSRLIAAGALLSNGSFEEDFIRMMFMSEIYGPASTFPPMALQISQECFKYKNKFIYLPPLF